ncbi:MAG: hypothetical protein COA42_12015 [Alteromonadaceae bacterium]|nr:MAG: hypothetical protein COA42_12015 [Alteromonadaceae bacterium]
MKVKLFLCTLGILTLNGCGGSGGGSVSSCDGVDTRPREVIISAVNADYQVNQFNTDDADQSVSDLLLNSVPLDLSVAHNTEDVAIIVNVSTETRLAEIAHNQLNFFRFSIFSSASACSLVPPELEDGIRSITVQTRLSIADLFPAGSDVSSLFSVTASRKSDEKALVSLDEWNTMASRPNHDAFGGVFTSSILVFSEASTTPEGDYALALRITTENGQIFTTELPSISVVR